MPNDKHQPLTEEQIECRREAGLARLLKMPPEPRGKPTGSETVAKKRGRPAKSPSDKGTRG